ncbi:hypothetical protein CLF_103310 [Clonorchis sinensis]|uniref:Uncharacterized protein n=1 Tax=Clonorchis sinensis TaxID=79923 RepID=G7Y9J2_CLOSI|nr:hypothetical protein CLF_103310 [Clonorchis sinensis]
MCGACEIRGKFCGKADFFLTRIKRIKTDLWVYKTPPSLKYHGCSELRANHQTECDSRGTVIAAPYLGSWTAPYMNISGPALRTDYSVHLASVLRALSARHMAPTLSGLSKSLLKPGHPVYLAAFNVRTLKQTKKAALALTRGINVCCISETRIQDSSKVFELTARSLSTRSRLRTSGDLGSAAAECAMLGIALSHRAKVSLLDLIPANSCLCTIRLATVKESQATS